MGRVINILLVYLWFLTNESFWPTIWSAQCQWYVLFLCSQIIDAVVCIFCFPLLAEWGYFRRVKNLKISLHVIPSPQSHVLDVFSMPHVFFNISSDTTMYPLQPSPWPFSLLKLKALGSEGMVQQLLQYLHRVESKFFSHILDTDIFNAVLHSLVEAKEVCSSYNFSNQLGYFCQ